MLREFTKGLIRENPVLVLLLGLCPTLAVTTGLVNAVGMGISATFVLVCSNVIIAIFKDVFPKKIRIPCFIVVIATFVTVVQMMLKAYVPDLDEALGIFIPLIVVNCIILGRAEAFAGRSGVVASLLDGVGMGLGFTMALCLIAFFRELLGTWRLGGVPVTDGGFQPASVMIMAPGAFIVLGLVLGAKAWSERRVSTGRLDAQAEAILSAERSTFSSEIEKARGAAEKKKERSAAAESAAAEERAAEPDGQESEGDGPGQAPESGGDV